MSLRISVSMPARMIEEVSDWVWAKCDFVEGMQEAPEGNMDLFHFEKGFEILEFGSESAKKAAQWLEDSAYRGRGSMRLLVFCASEQSDLAKIFFQDVLIKKFPELEILSFEELAEKDYLEEYRRNVRGQEVSKKWWVGPPWDLMDQKSNRIPLIVEPGLAFGTGEHPTTQMILERLEELAADGLQPRRVWDLGAGTGVLGLAAKKIFPSIEFLLMSDIDPLCLFEIQKTFALNETKIEDGTIELRCGDHGSAQSIVSNYSQFDLIISNIYAEVLAELAPSITKAMHVGSRWLCSGILEGPSEEIFKRSVESNFLENARRSKIKSFTEMNSVDGMKKVDECWVFREYALRR